MKSRERLAEALVQFSLSHFILEIPLHAENLLDWRNYKIVQHIKLQMMTELNKTTIEHKKFV